MALPISVTDDMGQAVSLFAHTFRPSGMHCSAPCKTLAPGHEPSACQSPCACSSCRAAPATPALPAWHAILTSESQTQDQQQSGCLHEAHGSPDCRSKKFQVLCPDDLTLQFWVKPGAAIPVALYCACQRKHISNCRLACVRRVRRSPGAVEGRTGQPQPSQCICPFDRLAAAKLCRCHLGLHWYVRRLLEDTRTEINATCISVAEVITPGP